MIRQFVRWACLLALLAVPPTPPPPLPAQPAPLADHTSYVPIVLNRPVPPPPPATESRYITKTASTTMYSYGCKQAESMQPNQNGYSLLLFGQPAYDKTTQEYGTRLLDGPRTFASIQTIETAAKYWADGFWACTPLQDSPNVILLVGTSNNGEEVTTEHGEEWALMVNRIGFYLLDQGFATRIAVAGANNIELSWNTPEVTRAWVDGYDRKNEYDYYNIGACEGCPSADYPDRQPNNGWTRQTSGMSPGRRLRRTPFPRSTRPHPPNSGSFWPNGLARTSSI